MAVVVVSNALAFGFFHYKVYFIYLILNLSIPFDPYIEIVKCNSSTWHRLH